MGVFRDDYRYVVRGFLKVAEDVFVSTLPFLTEDYFLYELFSGWKVARGKM